MKRICFLNGKWLHKDKARISVFDSGFLYGYGVFETIRIANGRALLLSEHLKRLRSSLQIAGIKITDYNFSSIVSKILKMTKLHDGVVRITVTAGRSKDLPWTGNASTPTVLVAVRELKIPEWIYTKGVKVIFIHERLKGASLAFPGVKSISYIANVIAKKEAQKKGAFEAIFVSPEGFLKEGASSNFFFIKNEIVYTPDTKTGILPGVTRNTVIKIIKKMGLKIEEGYFRVNDFKRSDEAFLTNSTCGVVPVAGKRKCIVNEIRKRYEQIFI